MGSPSFSKKTLEQNGQQIYSYQSEDGDIGIDIVADTALISDLRLKGRSVICGPKSDEDISSNPSFKSAYLTPFPNRLKGGSFEFEGKQYSFPINDNTFENALHGITINAPFKLVDAVSYTHLTLPTNREV